MALTETSPGYWSDPALDGEAGTFAVIIGASHYDHLPAAPDDAAVASTYGLGQLSVSALTGYRFFEWLRDRYSFPRAPLSRCWVLASPTPAESAVEPGLDSLPRPTLDNCADTLGLLVQALEALPPSYIADSRVIFFFSGHGVERYPNQLLCPSDYLKPPLRNPNAALSLLNIRGGLRRFSLREDFFFIDACRSNPPELANEKLEGNLLMREMPAFMASANRSTPILYGTKSGAEAWQPATPQEGLSIFGEALLEGLSGNAPLDDRCGHPPGHITIDRVAEYLRTRVREMLESRGHTVSDPIRRGGEYGEACITEPPAAAAAGANKQLDDAFAGAVELGAAADAAAEDLRMTGDAAAEELDMVGDAAADDFAMAGDASANDLEAVAPAPAPARPPVPAGGVDTRTGDLYSLLQSERLTAMIGNAEATPLNARLERSALRVHEIEWEGKEGVRLTISAERPGPHWLQMSDGYGMSYGLTLPADDWDRPLYVLELARERNAPLRRFEAYLSPANDGVLGMVAELWIRYRDLRLRDAVDDLDQHFFERTLAGKMQAPLAATVAGLFLLRCRQYDRLHDWLGNLARWFPQRTDGAVLRAEHLRQAVQAETLPDEYTHQLLAVARGPLPQLGEVLGYVADQTRELVTCRRDEILDCSAQDSATIDALAERLDRAMRHFRSGGLCSAFVGPEHAISIDLIAAPHPLIAEE